MNLGFSSSSNNLWSLILIFALFFLLFLFFDKFWTVAAILLANLLISELQKLIWLNGDTFMPQVYNLIMDEYFIIFLIQNLSLLLFFLLSFFLCRKL